MTSILSERRRDLVAVTLLLAGLVGCTQSGGDDGAPPETTTTAPTTTVLTYDECATERRATGAYSPECQALVDDLTGDLDNLVDGFIEEQYRECIDSRTASSLPTEPCEEIYGEGGAGHLP